MFATEVASLFYFGNIAITFQIFHAGHVHLNDIKRNQSCIQFSKESLPSSLRLRGHQQ
jgi:hypothetical protein